MAYCEKRAAQAWTVPASVAYKVKIDEMFYGSLLSTHFSHWCEHVTKSSGGKQECKGWVTFPLMKAQIWNDVSWVAARRGELMFWIIMLMSCILNKNAPSKSIWVSSLRTQFHCPKCAVKSFYKAFRQINERLSGKYWQTFCSDGWIILIHTE